MVVQCCIICNPPPPALSLHIYTAASDRYAQIWKTEVKEGPIKGTNGKAMPDGAHNRFNVVINTRSCFTLAMTLQPEEDERYGARFRQQFSLKRVCVTNGIPLGCSLILPVGTVNSANH
jgi:hypothetical protein